MIFIIITTVIIITINDAVTANTIIYCWEKPLHIFRRKVEQLSFAPLGLVVEPGDFLL